MSDRHTADTITDDALDALYERLRKAERAANLLADAHCQAEQVEEPLPDGQHPATASPAQWLWLFNRATPQERLAWAERIIKAGQEAATCVLENHRTNVEQQRQRVAELEDRITHLRDRWASCRERVRIAADRAIAAEAALDRVRALADRLDEFAENALKTSDRQLYTAIANDIRNHATPDQTKEQR
ncbi:hypothetical protein ACPCUF_23840 [Streptomyces griseoincarnatus]